MSQAFFEADWKHKGVLNNVQFFVLWRDLEERWIRAGQLIQVLTDAQMGLLYKLINEFDRSEVEVAGVTLDDII